MKKFKKVIRVSDVFIGGDKPVVIQSMTNTDTCDADATVTQINELYEAGCQIVRVAVPNLEACKALHKICAVSPIPVVADIHFDYKLAIASVDAGASKIRINPGNIGSRDRVKAVARACLTYSVPIRIGVNSGSIEKNILEKYQVASPEAMVESAFYHISLLNDCGFDDICISLKSSSVKDMIMAYTIMHERSDYPLHLGVTEAGTKHMGILKSAIGIGSLLATGIGDTIRVSLTENPVEEILAAKDIIKASGRVNSGVNIISCPTCGRCRIDLMTLVRNAEDRLSHLDHPLTVAIMGCAVNGPGEARHADFGIAGGDGNGIIFRNGEIIKKVPQEILVDTLMCEINTFLGEKNGGY